jgi:hypothetical protein
MKILSYKILSEAKGILGVGGFRSSREGGPKGLVGANMAAKRFGQKVYDDYYFDELLKLHFQILQYQNNQYSVVGNYDVLFAVKREDNDLKLFLHPYSQYKINDLVRENAQKYGSLTLYDFDNPPNKVSWANPNNLEGENFRFNFTIGDTNYFSKANQLYKFSNLNNMLGLSTNGINTNHIIKILGASNYSKIQSYTNRYNLTTVNGIYDVTIKFRRQNISWFVAGDKYNIIFNSATYNGQKPQGYTNVTSFQKANGEIAYIFTPTNEPLKNNSMQTYKLCYILLPNSNITQTAIEFKVDSINKT